MSPPPQALSVAALALALALAIPGAWMLGGCLQGTTAGAGIARVVTPEEAADATDATLSVKDDKFAGVTLTRLQENLLPDATASMLDKVYFDGVCIDQACLAVLRLTGVTPLTEEYQRLHLIVDGVAFRDLRGKPSITVGGFEVDGDLVVPFDAEVMRALIAAQEIEYRIEPTGVGSTGLDGDDAVIEGQLSRENVLNIRELLSLAKVDPWSIEDPVKDGPREEPTVGAPPNKDGARTEPVLGSPP